MRDFIKFYIFIYYNNDKNDFYLGGVIIMGREKA